tara:strand:+ start:639 stop:869 length:231 start_codon:yes stop_codon:yes gene_type:complete
MIEIKIKIKEEPCGGVGQRVLSHATGEATESEMRVFNAYVEDISECMARIGNLQKASFKEGSKVFEKIRKNHEDWG